MLVVRRGLIGFGTLLARSGESAMSCSRISMRLACAATQTEETPHGKTSIAVWDHFAFDLLAMRTSPCAANPRPGWRPGMVEPFGIPGRGALRQ